MLNNSATNCSDYTIQFEGEFSCLIIKDGERKESVSNTVNLSLSAGAFALIICR